jgi:hypothetical protein
MPVTHTFVSAIADDPASAAAGEVLPSHWNASHTISVNMSELNATGTPSAANFLRGDGAWSNTITSVSATAFNVGANGATNPALTIDNSLASANTGIVITAGANSGSNLTTITMTSPSAAGNLQISAKGTGSIRTTGSGGVIFQPDGGTRGTFTASRYVFTPSAQGTVSTPAFAWTGAAALSMAASVEYTQIYWNMGQVNQHGTGNITLQRDFRITPMTHSAVGASVITDAAGFSVDTAPVAGTNVTITNSSAIYSAGGAVAAGVTNSYGINISANTGATNNYVGRFGAGVIQQTPIAIASLIAAGTAGAGARSIVNDALAPVFGATVAAGGAVVVPVYSDGTNWKVG